MKERIQKEVHHHTIKDSVIHPQRHLSHQEKQLPKNVAHQAQSFRVVRRGDHLAQENDLLVREKGLPSPRKRSPKSRSRSGTPDRSKEKEDKAMLLQTFFLLQQQGVKTELKLDMATDISIIKSEITRMQTELSSQKMIKFSRKALIAFVSGIEFLNSRYDPFSLHLNGWSEHVMTTLGDYDSVFLRLYDKYKDSTNQLSPEAELMLLLGGSGLMFHLTQSFVQQNVPKFTEVAKENPNLASTIAGIMAEKYAKKEVQSSDDESDDESVTTQTLNFTNSRLKGDDHPSNFQIPTEILSTPAFPAIINKMVAPRPKIQPMPKKVLETIDEKEVDVSTKEKNKKGERHTS